MGIGTIGGATESAVKRALGGLGFDFSDGIRYEDNSYIFSITSDGIFLGVDGGPSVDSSNGNLSIETPSGSAVRIGDGQVGVGDGNTGIILHTSSGTTKSGVSVSVSNWIEIYGEEVHFSDTQ